MLLVLKNERSEGRALVCIIAYVPVHSPGRGRHAASAEKSCSTQEAGQADPRRDIERGGRREGGGTTEIDHFYPLGHRARDPWGSFPRAEDSAGQNTVCARLWGRQGRKKCRNSAFLLPFLPLLLSSHPPQMVKLKQKTK